MIEQTEMNVTGWDYFPPETTITEDDNVLSLTSLEVMRKRASTKKGIAMRFTCEFKLNDVTILIYTCEHSYVMDFSDVVDKPELIRMIRNSHSSFKEKFEIRKLGTVLQNRSVGPLNESLIDLDAIIPLLI